MTHTLGIELGSTRIKAVLIDENHDPVATAGHNWENILEGGIWTYHIEDVWIGIQNVFSGIMDELKKKNIELCLEAIGISAMMHGYLVFDKEGKLLVPFRTWRNTMTGEASEILTNEFDFNIPQRWSVAHLYQAVLKDEKHVEDIAFITTLAGYVHWALTGEKLVGIGEASGMFPVRDGEYDHDMLNKFDDLANKYPWKMKDILPEIRLAGEGGGHLTPVGAKLLDPVGDLKPGISFCPPEGDAGTGMVATNSTAERTGNVSAGTSIFAMIVLEKELTKLYPEIDIVTTPAGKYVAMVHCNNCTSDLDIWVQLFAEVSDLEGDALYDFLYSKALEGEPDCGGLISCNYLSGEHTTGFEEGRPLMSRMPDSNFNLANFMRSMLYSSIATLKLGMDILSEEENVKLDVLLGQGGLFKTKGVAQKLMAGAFDVPVAVMETAGEGGPWGMAILAAYSVRKSENESLEEYLKKRVFAASKSVCIAPDKQDVSGFEKYILRYKQILAVEKSAVENLV